MSSKEARRVYVLEELLAGKLTIRQAAQLLGLSERQVKRLKAGVKKEGLMALAHKNRGQKPKHAVPQEVRDKVVNFVSGSYRDASCEHMAELLKEHQDIALSPKTISRIITQAGITNPHSHKACRKRRSRDRMPREGMLLQFDASPFLWLEDRGPKLSLHGAVDDATGKILGLFFRLQEDAYGYFNVLYQVLTNHGVPRTVYSDRHAIFFPLKPSKLSLQEELAGKKAPLTQFGRALDLLGIAHVPARSPQAKGRVERLWGTLQSRLVIELRLAGVSSLEEANSFLPGFIEKFNRRFSVAPADTATAFLPCPALKDLRRIVSFRHERKASNGSTISFEGVAYLLVNSMGSQVALRPRSPVYVIRHLDGSLSALHNDKPYSLQVFAAKPSINPKPKPELKRSPPKPASDHPWKRRFASRASDPVERFFDEETNSFWEKVYSER